MVFGIAVGDANGVLVALGDRVATEGKAGRVERMEALHNAFLGTNSQSQLAQQQITPIGMDFIECPTKRKAIEGALTAVAPVAFAPGSVVVLPPRIDVLALAPGTLEWTIFPPQRMNVNLTLVDVEELVEV